MAKTKSKGKPTKQYNTGGVQSSKPKGARYSIGELLRLDPKLNKVQKTRLKNAGLLDERSLLFRGRGNMTAKESARLKQLGLSGTRMKMLGKQEAAYEKKHGYPDLNKYLALDSDYQRTKSNLSKNLTTAGVRYGQQDKDLTGDYNLTKGRLEREQGNARTTLSNQSASQGLFGSGLYAKSRSKLDTGFAEQFNDASKSYQRNKRDIQNNWQDAKRLSSQQTQQAKADAIRRRAAKYGIS